MCMVVITEDKKYDQILYNYGHASGNFFFVKHDKNSTFFTFPTSVQHEN